jgi:hypothetical protein
MRIVFVLGDGRTVEMPTEQLNFTCTTLFDAHYPKLVEQTQDEVQWLEELWKLEDKR